MQFLQIQEQRNHFIKIETRSTVRNRLVASIELFYLPFLDIFKCFYEYINPKIQTWELLTSPKSNIIKWGSNYEGNTLLATMNLSKKINNPYIF